MKTSILILAAIVLAMPASVRAANDAFPPPEWTREMQDAAEKLRQGLDQALGSVDTLLRALPQYEMPRIDDNGDIIIRRKRPADPAWPQHEPGGRAT
jgi:hypothetical protein